MRAAASGLSARGRRLIGASGKKGRQQYERQSREQPTRRPSPGVANFVQERCGMAQQQEQRAS
jgi:hypothetical protein